MFLRLDRNVFSPVRLLRIPEPFDHSDFIYELKFDGFRTVAHIDGNHCRLVSRNGHEFSRWDVLKRGPTGAVKASTVVLDGELVCLDRHGRPDFYALLFPTVGSAHSNSWDRSRSR